MFRYALCCLQLVPTPGSSTTAAHLCSLLSLSFVLSDCESRSEGVERVLTHDEFKMFAVTDDIIAHTNDVLWWCNGSKHLSKRVCSGAVAVVVFVSQQKRPVCMNFSFINQTMTSIVLIRKFPNHIMTS